MTTIYLSHDVAPSDVAAIRRLLDGTSAHNPSWNGAEFKIDRDEHTWIDTPDQINGAELLAQIYNIIDRSW